MKSSIYITTLLAIALMVCSCNNDEFNEADFVTSISSISLTVKGTQIMEYNSSYHQVAWNEERMQFRMMDDSLGNYFVVNLSSLPSEMGDVVSAELIYTTYTSIKTINDKFSASKISNSSSGQLVWLWNESTQTGVVIQEIN